MPPPLSDLTTPETIEAVTALQGAVTDSVVIAHQAAEAREQVRSADSAYLLAKVDEKLKQYNQQNMDTIASSMVEVINDALGKSPTRYFDASRIPLLCKSIMDLHENVKEVKQMMKKLPETFVSQEVFSPFRSVIYGLVSVCLLGIAGAILSLVLKQ